ncbi:MAG: sugar phosphate isomerase/epimerase family protein [Planctomycetota bacterium]|nr:sugar phosphate isomerase/epimerase family protein [Planctomycetota bacterium]MDP7132851.1 sugar phosphate isomerase/epimerase family protein [Planctomycetota bacterium]MDP7249392.1 sugar phosphate isomerase/epimerase family protein [Planctomycetota bacterium]
MNYAFMSFSCPELSFAEMLSTATEIGYDGIEPRTVSNHQHGVEVEADAALRDSLRQQAADAGVVIACVACSGRYANPADSDEHVQGTRDHIDLAADIGCTRLRVFGGGLGEGLSREDAVAHAGEALKSLADHAGERGVTVCLETHDSWCDPRDVASLMEYVGHPNIAVNWDIMHPVRTGFATMEESYEILKPWVRHVHFHDGTSDGLCPIGEGDIDHQVAVQLLQKDGYEDFLSGEWIGWTPHEEHLPVELATMRGYES